MTVVVIPCFNESPDAIDETVASALSLLRVERVILVDDGSDSPVLADGNNLLEHARVTIMRQPANRGVSAAMNEAIATVEGDPLIARLEVGDEFTDAKDDMLRAMGTGVRAAFSWYADTATPDRAVRRPLPNWRTRIYTDNMFSAPTTVYRASVWREVGGYDESLRYCDDWDFAMRVQHAVGWIEYGGATALCGQLPGGWSDQARTDPAKAKRRDAERRAVYLRGRALSHPGPYRTRRA
jgi:glycosyltransferase involved in cell wall biosynthesis